MKLVAMFFVILLATLIRSGLGQNKTKKSQRVSYGTAIAAISKATPSTANPPPSIPLLIPRRRHQAPLHPLFFPFCCNRHPSTRSFLTSTLTSTGVESSGRVLSSPKKKKREKVTRDLSFLRLEACGERRFRALATWTVSSTCPSGISGRVEQATKMREK